MSLSKKCVSFFRFLSGKMHLVSGTSDGDRERLGRLSKGIDLTDLSRCCRWPATSWVHYTTSCKTQSSAPEDLLS